ncbi:unnamed protein product [Dimorphilus gyrociliatus]|uniref:RING-type domain-containing protein n=1 Tax=Dimorphilus gyrociliatus TaxID=2664684 RepID=A0A7I8V811_9ANNE|nr:unnamed protein product [Dimorphilus gyrociliatus]
MAEFSRTFEELHEVNVFFNENDVLCGICRAPWITKYPRCLPCETSHIFCSKCLDRLINASLLKGYLLCPICRKEYPLTDKGVKAFSLLSPFVNCSLASGRDYQPLYKSNIEICDDNPISQIPSVSDDFSIRDDTFQRFRSQASIKFLRFESRVNHMYCLNGIPYCLTEARKAGRFKYTILRLLNDNRAAEKVASWTSATACQRIAPNKDIYLLTGFGSRRRIKRLKLKEEGGDRSNSDNSSLELKDVETICPRLSHLTPCADGFVLIHDKYLEFYTIRPLRLSRKIPLPTLRRVVTVKYAKSQVFVLFDRGQLFSIDIKTKPSEFQPVNLTFLENVTHFQNEVFNSMKHGKILMTDRKWIFVITLETKTAVCLPHQPIFGSFTLLEYFITKNEIVFYVVAKEGLIAIRYFDFTQ